MHFFKSMCGKLVQLENAGTVEQGGLQECSTPAGLIDLLSASRRMIIGKSTVEACSMDKICL